MPQPIPITTTETWPLDRFKPVERELARHSDPDTILRLGDDMLAKGQLQPVGAMSSGVMIYGHGRWLAALKKGILVLEVKVYAESLSETLVRLIRAPENLHRKDSTGWQKFTLCSDLMCGNPSWQMQDLAKALNQDPSSITRILSPAKCTEAWQNALRDGKVGVSDCYAASKLPHSQQAGLLALKLSGATRDQIEEAGRKVRAPKVDAVKLSRVTCPLAGGVKVTVAGAEMTLEDLIEALQSALEAARKANRDGLDVRTMERVLRDKAKAV